MTGSGRAIESGSELESLYRESRARLVQFLVGKLRSRQDAEDVAQDVFLALPEVSADRPIHNPRALIFRIARNLAINRGSQETRRAELRAQNVEILWSAVDEISPERALLDHEALHHVSAAVETLPERTRQILGWRRLDGLTNREIAHRLSISETAVEKHMRNAMARLVEAIGALDQG